MNAWSHQTEKQKIEIITRGFVRSPFRDPGLSLNTPLCSKISENPTTDPFFPALKHLWSGVADPPLRIFKSVQREFHLYVWYIDPASNARVLLCHSLCCFSKFCVISTFEPDVTFSFNIQRM